MAPQAKTATVNINAGMVNVIFKGRKPCPQAEVRFFCLRVKTQFTRKEAKCDNIILIVLLLALASTAFTILSH